ncbi:cell division protein FtsB [Neisseriaceae bacterium PsAf]|nr:cell division protein FtsB [Neisseriaceae bacterium PsAf]MCV2502492.1 septum formation initiator family protein [Neisseriaceae bacterium]
MKFIAIFLLVCVIFLQYNIWTGKGGWKDFSSIGTELAQLEEQNKELQVRNDAMQAEIDDLKSGSDAIAETARKDLGFIHNDEIYYQIIP